MKHIRRIDAYACLLATTIFVTNGCSTSYTVTPTQGGGDYSYNDLGSEFDRKQANINLKGGLDFHGSQIRANADSLYWTDPASSKHYAVAVHEVQRITRTNHLIGAVKGLGFGVLGAVFVAAADRGGGGPDEPGFAFAVIAAVAPPPLGLIIGAIIGHPYEYSFPMDSTNAQQKQR